MPYNPIPFLGRRAVTPVMATLVLLIFALAMGFAIVYFDHPVGAQDQVCSGFSDVRLVYVQNIPRICQIQAENGKNGSVTMLIENNGDTAVDGLHLTLIGNSPNADNAVYIIRDYNISLGASGALSKKYVFPASLGSLDQVKVSVYRKISSYYNLCNKPSIIVENLPECT